MSVFDILIGRRRLLAGAMTLGGMTAALAAEPPGRTPDQPTGPFYPSRKPLDGDNDLTVVAGRAAPAEGRILHLTGRVLDSEGRPLGGAKVEIWQTDTFGRYHHPGDRRDAPLDPNFQGYGRDVADGDGRYRFRTVEPAAYPAGGDWIRPPHIHFKVRVPGSDPLVTQMYFAGNPLNRHDRLLGAIRDPAARARLVVTLQPPPPDLDPDSRLAAFDLVLGSRG